MRRQTSKPSMSGSITSSTTASKAPRSRAASPPAARAAVGLEAGRRQVVGHHGGEADIVVDDQETVRHGARLLLVAVAATPRDRPPGRLGAVAAMAPPAGAGTARTALHEACDAIGDLDALIGRQHGGDVRHRLGDALRIRRRCRRYARPAASRSPRYRASAPSTIRAPACGIPAASRAPDPCRRRPRQ